ncbi:putative transcription elongation factor SPT5 homolog 1 isoform X2 [Selaginella moellendorffii]|uniref:putative transcription elongation factor SPT5 homolog 1 isoform X2 n=1 Tax=Selaginella moellendorffii TaxID=88036 RepID=UPI000D1C49A9|nr:putative transcription elongation factor SPT5 homolog 1 isoform X2 [Selaginella moellendorffii]|eukprot:XP_024532510.1 putative transcription elongation factor SPT5 homolog 1 isoform X2 [Selaginella moellendorffii]
MGAQNYDDDEEVEEEEEEEPEGEDLDDDEDYEEEDRKKRKRKQKRNSYVDDVAEEDEDEEDDAPSRKKRGRSRASAFIDDAAQVASDEEEEEEEEEEGFIEDTIPEEESSRRSRIPQRPALLDTGEDLEDIEIEKMLQQRYKTTSYDTYDDSEATVVEQQALLPSVKDPKLYMLTCPQGHEREAVVCLMQKYLDFQAKNEPLLIKSAVAIDHLKGFIYVEADKEAYVKQAIKGLRNIFPKTIHLVPIKEMTDVLTVEKKSFDIDKENWVRVKTGLYKGDLARVLDVDHVRQRARIKLVPRVEIQELVAKLEGKEIPKSKGFSVRPPQRFVMQELREMKVHIERRRDARGDHYEQVANMQFMDGYLIKNVSLKTLNAVDVMPSLDELQSFQKPGDDDSVDAFGLSSSRKRGQFVKGDTVVAVEGDLKGIQGVVEKVDEDNVEIRPDKKSGLKDVLRFHIKQLSKHFEPGNHVKVTSGKHEGATGMIVKIERDSVIILSDTTKEDVRVFRDSIVETSEVTCGLTKLGEFELHDLIALDPMTVGVIVRIEADGCQVLKGTPDKQEVITVKQRDLRKRLYNKMINTQDRDTNVVSVKDIVRVVSGPFKGKQGVVEHINRGILFVQDRQHLENGGFICVRATSCLALGGSRGDKQNHIAAAFSSLKPPSQFLQSPRRSPVRGPYGPPSGFVSNPGRRNDNYVGRSVKIRTGPYKGYRGRVVDASGGRSVRIELESQMKIVTVDRDILSDIGDVQSSFREPTRYGMGSQTPVHPSRTPMHSAYMTPMRDSSATPIHDGMRTPMRDRAWNPTTPLRDDTGWGAHTTSPQYMQQPGTPLATRSYEAPTPGSGWANTPGSYADSGSPVEAVAHYGNPSSPYLPGTPGALPMTPAVPGTPGGQPMTPGSGVLDPTSPATGFNMHELEKQWGLPELMVTLRRNGDTTIGVIEEVLPDGYCRLSIGDDTVTVSHSEIEIVQPEKNDRIKVVYGEFRGVSGKLIGIDSDDGIVRTGTDVKILNMKFLGKVGK